MSRYSVVIAAHEDSRQLLASLLALKQHAAPHEVLLVSPTRTGATDTSHVPSSTGGAGGAGGAGDAPAGAAHPASHLTGLIALSRLPVRVVTWPAPGSLGAAYNAGLDRATCDVVILLHRALLECAPTPAIDLLASREDIGVVGTRMLMSEPPPRRIWQAGYDLGRGRVAPVPLGRGEWPRDSTAREVAAVSGACMVVRRTDIRFDERYWFRLEDVDFCLQHAQRGFRVLLQPAFQAVRLAPPPTFSPAYSTLALPCDQTPHWASRLLASQLLYHQRWCSGAPLNRLPARRPARAVAAIQHYRQVDAWCLSRSSVDTLPQPENATDSPPGKPLLNPFNTY